MKKIIVLTLLFTISIITLAGCSFLSNLVTTTNSTTIPATTTGGVTTTNQTTEPAITTTTPQTGSTAETTTTSTEPVVEMVNVSFNTKYGSEVPTQRIQKGGKATRPTENPTKDGTATVEYVFDDWYTTSTGNVKFDFESVIEQDTIIYAHWNTQAVTVKYTITFMNPLTGEEVQKVENSLTIPTELPSLLDTEAYHFVGWTKNLTTKELVQAGSSISDNTVLYAVWEEIVTSFDINVVGISITKLENVSVGATLSSLYTEYPVLREPKAVTNPDDYYFDGWYTDSSYKTRLNDLQELSSDIKTIYAKFVKKTFSVFFLTNNGNVEKTFEIGFEMKESDTPNPGLDASREFIGWSTDLTNPITYPYIINKTDNFYALSKDATYTVTFMADGDVVDTKSVIYQGTIRELPLAPASENGEFIGWSYNGVAFTTSTKVEGNMTVVAVYEGSEIIKGFSNNDKDLKAWSTVSGQESITADKYVLPNTVEIDGFTFQANNKAYFKTNNVSFNPQGADILVELTGKTNEIHLTGTWGSSSSGNIVFKTSDGTSIKTFGPYDNTSSGKVIKDIYVNNLSAGTYKISTGSSCHIETIYVVESNTQKLKYNVSFVNTDNREYENKVVVSGETVSAPSTNPTYSLEGYTYEFKYWALEDNMNEAFDFTTPIASDIKLVAVYDVSVNVYDVTFVLNNGDDDIVVKCEHNKTVSAPLNSPQKDGFEFAGWYKDSSLKEVFDFDTLITKTTSIYAKYKKISTSGIKVNEAKGYNEGIYLLLDGSAIEYKIYYKLQADTTYVKVDDDLIRIIDPINDIVRCDILGLAKGKYEVKITDASDESVNEIITGINVSELDRSGYAHFGSSNGVGAYNNDGTLKENAVVIYVTEDNKNTLSAVLGGKTYTGLGSICANLYKSTYPVDIRILGRISAATWNALSVSKYSQATTTTVRGANGNYLALQNYDEDAIISSGFNTLNLDVSTKLNGLTNKIKYDSSKKEFDSYYNMMDINKANNVTIEGVGEGAEIFQWGFTWKSSNSIEVRNLIFTDYTEDACSFEGSGSDSELTTFDAFANRRIWLHHNTFNVGKNYWDVCSEQDKHDGDGATDFKRVCYVTVSYNHYIKNHKTGLVGGSDSQMTASLTFHHNFYDECQSRLPFAREANMHMYNNYYYGSTGTNMQIYAGAYAFIENCYFENVKKTFDINSRGIATAAVKSFNNIYTNCGNYSGTTIVDSRTTSVDNGNVFAPHFDTDSTVFYYDNLNQKSDVKNMLSAEEVKTVIPTCAGAENYCS